MSDAYQREFTPLAAAGWTVSVMLGMGLVLIAASGGKVDGEVDLMTIGLTIALVHTGIAFAAVRVHAPLGSLRVLFGVGRPRLLDFLLSAVAAIGMVPLLDWIDTLLKRRFPPEAKEALDNATLFANASLGQRVKIAVVMIALVPVAQELFFRGIVFSGLAARARGRTWVAGVVSTAAFALTSGSIREIVQMAVLGAMLACVRAWSASVVVSTFAHASYYVIPILPLLQGRAYDATIGFTQVQMIAMASAAVVALVVLRLRAQPVAYPPAE